MANYNNGVTIKTGGISGMAIGMLLSWLKFHSIFSLIWPGLFGWFYVIYFAIRYGTNF